MGAQLNTRTYKNQMAAEDNWASDWYTAQMEEGNCYSGDINMLTTNLPSEVDAKVETRSDAMDFIADNNDGDDVTLVELPDGSIIAGGWCSC